VKEVIKMSDKTFKVFLEIIGLLWEYELPGLAKEAEVSQSTLYNWMHGKVHAPRLDTLTKVAKVLGYEIVLQRVQASQKKAA